MILFFPFDLLSHNLRCLQLAKGIVGEMDIMFASSKKYQHFIEEAGFKTFDCDGIPVSLVMESAQEFNFSWIKEDILETSFLAQVAAIKKYKPKVVIGDASFTLRMAAAYTQTPYVSIINGYMSAYYAALRRLPPSHPIVTSNKNTPPKVFNAISKVAEKIMMWHVHKPFRKLARKHGIPLKKNLLEELQGDMTLIADLQELFPQKTLPSHHKHIGPLFHLSGKSDAEANSWIDPSKQTIYVTIGSSGQGFDLRFLASPKYSKYNVLIAGQEGKTLSSPHIFSKSFIEMGGLLSNVHLVICHGGNGSIYQALHAGVPVLCSPTHFEQEWNLQGLEKVGWGERLHEDPNERIFQIERWIDFKDKVMPKDLLPKTDPEASVRSFSHHLHHFLH